MGIHEYVASMMRGLAKREQQGGLVRVLGG